jgi:hypothetical protein
MSKRGNENWSPDTKKAFEQAKIPKKKLQQEINEKATTPGKKGWVDLLGEVMGTSETIGGGRSGGGGGGGY